MEGFDPLSQGPNMAAENPYPEWNEKMRRLEEGGNVIYKDRQGGNWVYWIDADGDRHIISRANVAKYLHQGYRIVPLEPWNDPKTMKGMSDKGLSETHPHGRYAQQAGATPFETPQDYQEVKGHRLQSTEVPWMCPHCKKETQIHVDIESPSDYIASNECEHCGQEINDPNLDSKVMQSIADYYAGRADYYKDLLREGFGGARLLNAKITNISAAGTPAQGTMGAVGKYTEYNVTAEVNLTVYSDSTDKALIAKDVYTRLRSALH